MKRNYGEHLTIIWNSFHIYKNNYYIPSRSPAVQSLQWYICKHHAVFTAAIGRHSEQQLVFEGLLH